MLLIFVSGFAMSAGPLIWVLCSEIYLLRGRDFGTTVSIITNWVANILISSTFLSILNVWRTSLTFLCYSLLNILFIFLIFIFFPETKNIYLEQIEKNLMAGKKLRDIGYNNL